MALNENEEWEFNQIVGDILRNDEFMLMKDEPHHGITRFEHSLNVAKTTFHWSKTLHIDVENITRAALLHDFFSNQELGNHFELTYHPNLALENAKNNFELNEIQQNVIISHMFPLCKTMPKYKESWLVTLADKHCSNYECCKYKFPIVAQTYLLFLFNLFIGDKL
jgi:uncharacterized protein